MTLTEHRNFLTIFPYVFIIRVTNLVGEHQQQHFSLEI